MHTIEGTVKNGVIYPLESVNLTEGQSVMIVLLEEIKEDKATQSKLKLSELLLLSELEENDPLFDRSRDSGRDITL